MSSINLKDGLLTSLNPCCSGYYALRCINVLQMSKTCIGLNPCCSGYYALRPDPGTLTVPYIGVSILVVVDITL